MPRRSLGSLKKEKLETVMPAFLQNAAERSPLWAAVLAKKAPSYDTRKTERDEGEDLLLPACLMIVGFMVSAAIGVGYFYS